MVDERRLDRGLSRDRHRCRNPIPPVICIPTTCGTGAEVTSVGRHHRPRSHFNWSSSRRTSRRRVAIVDPELVQAAPAHVIAATGADALAHAVESYVNIGSDPLLDALNIAADPHDRREPARAPCDERDPDAIGQLALASTMTGIAFNMNANAIVHAASTPVTAHHGVPHGVANAIFMPAGLDFLRPRARRAARRIADALGEDVAGLSAAEAAERGVDAIRSLLADVGIPPTPARVRPRPDDHRHPARSWRTR